MTWKGTWSAATAYVVNDAVNSAGSSYICITGNTNQVPPNANWSLLAQVGAAGATGPTGSTGPAGSTGAAGTPGTKWFNGTGNPGVVSGSSPGDYYLDTASGNVWVL
jgi:hypothetical protein